MRPACQLWQPLRGAPSGVAHYLVHRASLGRRQVAADATSQKKATLGHIDPAYRNDVAGILDKAEASLDLWTPTYTDFFPPPVTAEALAVLKVSCCTQIALTQVGLLKGHGNNVWCVRGHCCSSCALGWVCQCRAHPYCHSQV